jgi:hypothetical protein
MIGSAGDNPPIPLKTELVVLGSSPRGRSLALAFAALSGGFACEPELSVGTWTCSKDGSAAVASSPTDPIALPWSAGFEDRFCDYTEPAGFCYGDALATYRTVASPVHSGRHAAAFSVNSADADAQQTRCVRQGTLPNAAYYGAWYFIPASATNTDLWNLLHFRGGDGGAYHGLWDVSLENGPGGSLELFVFDFLNGEILRPGTPTPVPIGSWFHVQLYLERARSATGRVALYQDGEVLFDRQNLVTDDSSYGQWYVGNLAHALTPPASTLYVDDVTIRATL